MDKQKFLVEIQQALEIETILTENTNLKELDEWDSMAAMILIGYVSENFNIELTPKEILELTTVQSLILKIGDDKFE
ncbi:Phosphopantetheine attachment site [compost metagenome]